MKNRLKRFPIKLSASKKLLFHRTRIKQKSTTIANRAAPALPYPSNTSSRSPLKPIARPKASLILLWRRNTTRRLRLKKRRRILWQRMLSTMKAKQKRVIHRRFSRVCTSMPKISSSSRDWDRVQPSMSASLCRSRLRAGGRILTLSKIFHNKRQSWKKRRKWYSFRLRSFRTCSSCVKLIEPLSRNFWLERSQEETRDSAFLPTDLRKMLLNSFRTLCSYPSRREISVLQTT